MKTNEGNFVTSDQSTNQTNLGNNAETQKILFYGHNEHEFPVKDGASNIRKRDSPTFNLQFNNIIVQNSISKSPNSENIDKNSNNSNNANNANNSNNVNNANLCLNEKKELEMDKLIANQNDLHIVLNYYCGLNNEIKDKVHFKINEINKLINNYEEISSNYTILKSHYKELMNRYQKLLEYTNNNEAKYVYGSINSKCLRFPLNKDEKEEFVKEFPSSNKYGLFVSKFQVKGNDLYKHKRKLTPPSNLHRITSTDNSKKRKQMSQKRIYFDKNENENENIQSIYESKINTPIKSKNKHSSLSLSLKQKMKEFSPRKQGLFSKYIKKIWDSRFK